MKFLASLRSFEFTRMTHAQFLSFRADATGIQRGICFCFFWSAAARRRFAFPFFCALSRLSSTNGRET